jgi:hypothetical protein
MYCKNKVTEQNIIKHTTHKTNYGLIIWHCICNFTAVNVREEALQEDQCMQYYLQLLALMPV